MSRNPCVFNIRRYFSQVYASGQSICTDEAGIYSAVITADEEILLATKVD